MATIVEFLRRANVKRGEGLALALTPLFYKNPPGPPHEDVLAALCAAGAIAEFKTILRTMPLSDAESAEHVLSRVRGNAWMIPPPYFVVEALVFFLCADCLSS